MGNEVDYGLVLQTRRRFIYQFSIQQKPWKSWILGFGLHLLLGNLKGFCSVYVSRNHRIIIRFEEGKAFDVDFRGFSFRRKNMAMKKPVHPGIIVKNAIEASGLNFTEEAKGLGITRPTLSRLIHTITSLSPENGHPGYKNVWFNPGTLAKDANGF